MSGFNFCTSLPNKNVTTWYSNWTSEILWKIVRTEKKGTLLRIWTLLSDRLTFLDMINTRPSTRYGAIIVVPTPRLRPGQTKIFPRPRKTNFLFSKTSRTTPEPHPASGNLVLVLSQELKRPGPEFYHWVPTGAGDRNESRYKHSSAPIIFFYGGRGANLPIKREKYFTAM
jgi:hypothetical protein